MERRSFLLSALAGLAPGSFPKRRFKENIDLSTIAFGGIVNVGLEQTEANRYVALAVDRGLNYFDVAPSYGKDGEAEIKLGPALAPYRKNCFLACKTQKRDAAGAREELERSLARLKTDHFDLYQFHAVSSMDQVKQILGPNGAAETFQKAKQEGKVRYLGFSAHSAEAALALMDGMALDSVLFPVNYVCWGQGNFGPQILAKAKQKGMARLALKAMAKTRWPQGARRAETNYPKCWYEPVEDRVQAQAALRFTLSQDITAAVPPGDERLWSLALELGSKFTPMPAAEQEKLLASARGMEPIFRA
jgi:aryl-alcohol dehydrogenase-like predicted oxidoreductase